MMSFHKILFPLSIVFISPQTVILFENLFLIIVEFQRCVNYFCIETWLSYSFLWLLTLILNISEVWDTVASWALSSDNTPALFNTIKSLINCTGTAGQELSVLK